MTDDQTTDIRELLDAMEAAEQARREQVRRLIESLMEENADA